MKSVGYQVLVFGLLTIVGGIIGFVSAGSEESIIAGGIAGILLVAGGWAVAQNQSWGFWLSLLVTITLLYRFASDFAVSGSIMPQFVMSVLSLWILGALFIYHLTERVADSH